MTDNQGVAINDALVSNEVSQGVLHLYENVVLEDYGYCLVYPESALERLEVRAFQDWIFDETEKLNSKPIGDRKHHFSYQFKTKSAKIE